MFGKAFSDRPNTMKVFITGFTGPLNRSHTARMRGSGRVEFVVDRRAKLKEDAVEAPKEAPKAIEGRELEVKKSKGANWESVRPCQVVGYACASPSIERQILGDD